MNIFEDFINKNDIDEIFTYWKNTEEAKGSYLHERFLYDEETQISDWDEEFESDYNEFTKASKEYHDFIEEKKEELIIERAREWFDSRVDEIINNFDYDYEYHDEENVVVYRSMTVLNPIDFIESIKKNYFGKYSGIGHCWAFSRDLAESHWGEKGQEILLKGLLKIEDINVRNTFYLNLDMSCGEDEAEVRVDDNKKVLITEMIIEETDKVFKLNHLVDC